ncbi:MAG: sigma-70 family RNA polymerase sigma factor [Myxococcales bacterium]|nr:sigma-70 family RNA polymerase sigma factor [Myxococcales bacterium]
MVNEIPPVVNDGECATLPTNSTIALPEDSPSTFGTDLNRPRESDNRSKNPLDELTPELIRRAYIDHDRAAEKIVLGRIETIVRYHVSLSLRRYAAQDGRDPSVYIDDYVSTTKEHLLKDNCRRLLDWKPELGSAQAYFGKITRNCVIQKLKSRKQNHQTETATDGEDFEKLTNDSGFSSMLDTILHKDLMLKLYDRLVATRSVREIMLFDLVYNDKMEPKEAAHLLGVTLDTFHQAHCRLLKRLKQIAQDLLRE